MKSSSIFLMVALLCVFVQCKQPTSTETKAAKYQNIKVAEAKSLIESNPQLVILDVRTPQETAEGIIPNAIEMDYKSPSFKTDIMKLDKTKSYLVYCRSGGRSSNACDLFEQNGFTDIYNLEGGYLSWSK